MVDTLTWPLAWIQWIHSELQTYQIERSKGNHLNVALSIWLFIKTYSFHVWELRLRNRDANVVWLCANSGIKMQFVDTVLTVEICVCNLAIETTHLSSGIVHFYILQLITILIALQNHSCKPCSANICNVFCTVLHVFQQPVNSYILVTLPTTSHLQVIVSPNHCL